jgi:sec-independent protein translocase protein TatC
LTIKGRPIHFSLKWLKPPPAPPDGTMTLFEHLRELCGCPICDAEARAR